MHWMHLRAGTAGRVNMHKKGQQNLDKKGPPRVEKGPKISATGRNFPPHIQIRALMTRTFLMK